MNLGSMETALADLVKDDTLSPGFAQNINDAILELAADFELPGLKLLEPESLSVDNTKWLWPLPDNFHKKLFRVANSSLDPWGEVHICRHIDELTWADMAHDDTGDHVSEVATALQGSTWYLGIKSLPDTTDILKLWYYRKPATLEDAGDEPDCIPPEFHYRVIVVKTVLRNWRHFTDAIEDGPMKSITYWEELYRRGLYGEYRGDIGLINYLAKIRGGPRRHGGRDPIGSGNYYRGYR